MTEANANKPPINETRRKLVKWGGLSLLGAFTGAVGAKLFGPEASQADATQAATATSTATPTELAPTTTNTATPTETATDIPSTATNTPQPTETPTNTPEPTATNTPEATATNTPQPTATETEVPKNAVVFDGNPNSEAGKALGDGGFRSECDFGNQECSTWQRIVWGPFARGIHHLESQGIKDNVTYRVTVEGKGQVRVGATDSKMYDGNMFGLGSVDANLSNGPVTYEFYWPGIGDDEANLKGYGFETIVQQLDGEKGRVDNIKIEIVN